jgi:hypothetical protein
MASDDRSTERMASRMIPAAIVLAALPPATAFALAARWPEALFAAIAGAAWLAGARGHLRWVSDAAFLSLLGLGAAGAASGVAPGWALAGALAALAAWDIAALGARLAGDARVVDAAGLWRAQLRRLGAVLGAGLLLGAAALIVRVEIGFVWALLLGIVAVATLGRAVRTSAE